MKGRARSALNGKSYMKISVTYTSREKETLKILSGNYSIDKPEVKETPAAVFKYNGDKELLVDFKEEFVIDTFKLIYDLYTAYTAFIGSLIPRITSYLTQWEPKNPESEEPDEDKEGTRVEE